MCYYPNILVRLVDSIRNLTVSLTNGRIENSISAKERVSLLTLSLELLFLDLAVEKSVKNERNSWRNSVEKAEYRKKFMTWFMFFKLYEICLRVLNVQSTLETKEMFNAKFSQFTTIDIRVILIWPPNFNQFFYQILIIFTTEL